MRKPTRVELLAAAGKTIPDVIAPDLKELADLVALFRVLRRSTERPRTR